MKPREALTLEFQNAVSRESIFNLNCIPCPSTLYYRLLPSSLFLHLNLVPGGQWHHHLRGELHKDAAWGDTQIIKEPLKKMGVGGQKTSLRVRNNDPFKNNKRGNKKRAIKRRVGFLPSTHSSTILLFPFFLFLSLCVPSITVSWLEFPNERKREGRKDGKRQAIKSKRNAGRARNARWFSSLIYFMLFLRHRLLRTLTISMCLIRKNKKTTYAWSEWSFLPAAQFFHCYYSRQL